ncbi:MAG: 3-hydroxyacyl-CoA dehydrogenase, partial [Pseudomonadota bacterium]
DHCRRRGVHQHLGEPARLDPQRGVEDVKSRLMLIQALEAVRALEEGVLTDIREGDVGAILGWGFAPWSGGPFAALDMMGLSQAVALCDRLTEIYGERFTTPALMREMADKGESFYGRFGPQTAVAAE